MDHFAGEAYLAEVGRFIVFWGFAEAHLDVANTIILHQGGKSIEPELPRSLDRKLAFFRKAHEKLEMFQPHAERVLPLCQGLAQLREFRHDMTHGTHLNYFAQDADQIMYRWKYEPDNLTAAYQNKYSALEIRENARTVLNIGRDLVAYVLLIGWPDR